MKKYLVLVIAVVVLGGGAFFMQQWFVGSFSTENRSQAPDAYSITFIAKTTSFVLDAMHTLAAEGSLSFSGRDFPGLGFFVEQMNGKYGADGFYWILYVNGKKSDFGASQMRLKEGDVVEWRYEKGY